MQHRDYQIIPPRRPHFEALSWEEIRAATILRRHIDQRAARTFMRQERRAGATVPQHTRAGVAQDYQNAERRRRELRAIAVAIRLGLR